MNLYQLSYDPASPCNNFLNSNGTRMTSTVNISTSFTQSLSPGIYYELTVGTFSNNFPALPLSYTHYQHQQCRGRTCTSNYPSPGAGFNYTYVIVNNTTGQIRAFDASANLSNANSYPPGSYVVYGLSHTSFYCSRQRSTGMLEAVSMLLNKPS